jgi:uncharacterized membrane protein
MSTQVKTLLHSRRSMLKSLLPMLGLGAWGGSVFAGYFLDPGAPRYTVEKITWPGAPSTVTATALNNKGHVAGISDTNSLFVWDNGRVQNVDFSELIKKVPLERSSGYYGVTVQLISDDELIAVYYQNDRSRFASFTYKDGKFNPGHPPWASPDFGVLSANSRGDAVGLYEPRDRIGQNWGFVYLNGKLSTGQGFGGGLLNDVGQVFNAGALQLTDASGVTDIPKPPKGGSVASVSGFNNLGQFVGDMEMYPPFKGQPRVAFVGNKKGQYELLDIGGIQSSAVGINDEGVVIGYRYTKFMGGVLSMGYGNKDPYVWIKGKAYDLGKASGLNLTESSGTAGDLNFKINNRGQILVTVKSGQSYLLTPKPSR